MTARRRKRKFKISRRNKSRKKIILYILLIFLIVIGSLIYVLFYKSGKWTGRWDGKSKLSIAIDNDEDGVFVVLLDPIHNEIHKFHYPEDLEIEAAMNLGEWKIGSLWKLGQDEDMGGELLARTVSKSLRTPVSSWSGQGLLDLLNGGLFTNLKSIASRDSSTNLSLTDRYRIYRFVSNVQDSNIINYEAKDLDFISEQELNDGTKGYVIDGDPSTKILSLFANDYILSKPNRAVIIYSGDNEWEAKGFGEVLEVVGVKIASIRGEAHEINYCEISAKDEFTAKHLSKYFSCNYNTKTSTNFDVEIRIGDGFAQGF